jgi:acyl-CoA dehydrogenase
MILVPKDTPGVRSSARCTCSAKTTRRTATCTSFNNVRVPKSNMLLGEGRGFEISQVRLGPGRIHHCMRSIGQAEKALDLMVQAWRVARGLRQEAGLAGRQMSSIISRARIEIEAMRLMVLKAAKAMDVLGNREARIWVHMVKAMVPERVCKIIDQAIQMHGALGVSQHTPLAHMYAQQRTLRLADGPGRSAPPGGHGRVAVVAGPRRRPAPGNGAGRFVCVGSFRGNCPRKASR